MFFFKSILIEEDERFCLFFGDFLIFSLVLVELVGHLVNLVTFAFLIFGEFSDELVIFLFIFISDLCSAGLSRLFFSSFLVSFVVGAWDEKTMTSLVVTEISFDGLVETGADVD